MKKKEIIKNILNLYFENLNDIKNFINIFKSKSI